MPTEIEKVAEWGYGFVLLICSLLLVTLILGFYFSYVSGLLAAMGFILLSAANIYAAFYATCRHCCYYGKRCYLALCLIVPYFFERAQEPGTDLKAELSMGLFVVNIIYPLIFLYQENAPGTFVVHSLAYRIYHFRDFAFWTIKVSSRADGREKGKVTFGSPCVGERVVWHPSDLLS